MIKQASSKYDFLAEEHAMTRKPISDAYKACIAFSVGLACILSSSLDGFSQLFAIIVAGWAGGTLLLALLTFVIPNLRQAKTKLAELSSSIKEITAKCREFHRQHPTREKGQRFKSVYTQEGSSIGEFEARMASGMHKEKKEVWVSAFCKQDRVLKVFASIGSARRCRPAENVTMYPEHIRRLNCDEIRQYHNHPIYTNFTDPSPEDIRTSTVLTNLVADTECPIRSFIIYWNAIAEHRLAEFDSNGDLLELRSFDVTKAKKKINPDSQRSK